LAIAAGITLALPATGYARDGRGHGGGGRARVVAAPPRMAAPRPVMAPRVVAAPRYVAPRMVAPRYVAPRMAAPRYVARAPVRYAPPVARRTVAPPVVARRAAIARAPIRTARPIARTAIATSPARTVAARNAAIAARTRRGLPPVAENVNAARRTRRAAAVSAAGFAAGRHAAIASRDPGWHHWRHDRVHHWHNHVYAWYNNAWIIADPGIYAYGYGYPYDSGYYGDTYPYVDYGTTYTAPEPVGESTVVNVQSQLSRLGYYGGSVDGIIGPQTRAAIRSFQRDHGLMITGTITPDLLTSLGF